MPFDFPSHDDFVARHGDVVIWRSAVKCSCSSTNTPDANRSRTDCDLCDGLGFVYAAPVSLTGLATSIEYSKQLLDAGIGAPGNMVLGLAPDEPNFVSDYDIIQLTVPGGEPYEGDTLQRRIDGLPDELAYTPVKITTCFSIIPGVDDVSPDTRVNYVRGVDFTISGRSLTWITGHGPDPGTPFSIKYTAQFDWEVFNAPMVRVEAGQSLGQRALLRKREIPIPIFDRD